ncbi:MAG TPA: LuxR C-terminal-related transcriptional regulator [Myxococcota bacterium]|nr:LuxR C-terminal-related transcriptional regulator [Myxococcota bacterium]
MDDHVTIADFADGLSREDLVEILSIAEASATCENEGDMTGLVRRFSALLGFEYAFGMYMRSSYDSRHPLHAFNISNPEEWLSEYHSKGYVMHDPVGQEIQRRLAGSETFGAISWAPFEVNLGPIESEILARRKSYGLNFGLSTFCNLGQQQSALLISFSSATSVPDDRTTVLCRAAMPHLTRARKRLELREKVGRLTRQELQVAGWLIEGKTNWEIAHILEVTESTVKFHVANILKKLEAPNRQNAVSILIAERFLT